jgi:hypothetical protein
VKRELSFPQLESVFGSFKAPTGLVRWFVIGFFVIIFFFSIIQYYVRCVLNVWALLVYWWCWLGCLKTVTGWLVFVFIVLDRWCRAYWNLINSRDLRSHPGVWQSHFEVRECSGWIGKCLRQPKIDAPLHRIDPYRSSLSRTDPIPSRIDPRLFQLTISFKF